MAELKTTSTSCKYTYVKRCLNCFYINPRSAVTCCHCGFVMIAEATEQEATTAAINLKNMRERRKDPMFE
jgi:hypothetical protein